MSKVSLPGRAGAEFLGTFWLVFGGCGSESGSGNIIAEPVTVANNSILSRVRQSILRMR